jgi:hypothetical protein
MDTEEMGMEASPAGPGLSQIQYPQLTRHSQGLLPHLFPESWACRQGCGFSNPGIERKGKENAFRISFTSALQCLCYFLALE